MTTSSRQSTATAHTTGTSTQLKAVNATSGGLLKATVGAALAAGAILTFVWLPAEYGIDPTGAGHMLGLTEMGHIKEQLHAEADADAAALASTEVLQTSHSNTELTTRLDQMQAQLSLIAAAVGVSASASEGQALQQTAVQPPATQAVAESAESSTALQAETPVVSVQEQAPVATADVWRDEESITLEPGEGIELKLVMQQGAVAQFEWTANGAVLNHDTHGDGNGRSISYEKGRSVPEQAGELTAAFTGNHGWFWRNRTDDPVQLTLRTRGDYEELVFR